MKTIIFALLLFLSTFLAACQPNPKANVLGYMLTEQIPIFGYTPQDGPTGTLTGIVLHEDKPVRNVTVVVAERSGTPHSARTDSRGRYQIEQIPPGQYVPAVTGPGFDEHSLQDRWGTPQLVTIRPDQITEAPPLNIKAHLPTQLPSPLAPAVSLRATAAYSATAPFPPDSQAQVQAFEFERDGLVVNSLRLYLPMELSANARLPLLFMIYPTYVDWWETVSVAFASQGFAFVAISPMAERAVDIDAHAADAHIALALAREGTLSHHIDEGRAIALGGSFSSAVLNRLLRDTGDEIAGWVTVGGISNTFRGTADFYAGRLTMPEQYKYVIPALGAPNIYPLDFLRYSPVYTAEQLPPTMIIHTDADRIVPIDQAYELEEALHMADIPVEVFYYEDVSHYLQIDENLSEAGMEMFSRIIDFAQRYLDMGQSPK